MKGTRINRISHAGAVMLCLSFLLFGIVTPGSTVHAREKKTITVGVPADRCPIFYRDEKTGEVIGIGADLMRLAAENAGYHVVIKETEEESLKESLDNPAYDLVMPLGSAVPSASGKSTIVSENLMETPFTFVTYNNRVLPPINHMRVGMLSSMAAGAETVSAMYPDMEIIFYPSMDECAWALRVGKVHALLHNSYVWSYFLEKPSYSKLTVQPAAIFSMDFRAGTVDSEQGRALISDIDKGISEISETRRQAIILDYTTRKLYHNNFIDYCYEYGLLVTVFLIIILLKTIESSRLRKANREVQNASRAKTMFLANMSHEIRTPLNSIMGMGEMISRETHDKKIQQYAYSVKSSANSLLLLVNDILDFSRMEAGKLKLIEDLYHLSHLITDVDMMIKPRADSKGLTYEVHIDPKTPEVLIGDETRLKQVLINLLTNGVKYTNTGFVRLTVGFEKAEIGDGKDRTEVIDLKITVSDSGIGMKQEDIDRLFQAFERLDEEKNRTIEGTGLGMSIVKQILDAMDSHLEVHSVYGEGSEFSFVVRQKVTGWDAIGDYEQTAEKVVSIHEDYRPAFVAPEARVLVVDDTELNLKVVTGLLKQTLIRVDTAFSGRQALDMTKSTEYDLLLIDYRMPEMDGVELLSHIRTDQSNPNHDHICIALTANVVEGGRKMYLEAGFDEYLEKPINSKRLEEALITFLPKEHVQDYESYRPEHEEPPRDDDSEFEDGISDEILSELERLNDAGVISVSEGVAYAGTRALYVQSLEFFRDSAVKKVDEIDRMYQTGDIQTYTTLVHGLKSSAKVIGADELSEKARLLEAAGKKEDWTFIREHHGILLDDYRHYMVLLKNI